MPNARGARVHLASRTRARSRPRDRRAPRRRRWPTAAAGRTAGPRTVMLLPRLAGRGSRSRRRSASGNTASGVTVTTSAGCAPLEDQQRGHDLREARDRPSSVGRLREQHLTVSRSARTATRRATARAATTRPQACRSDCGNGESDPSGGTGVGGGAVLTPTRARSAPTGRRRRARRRARRARRARTRGLTRSGGCPAGSCAAAPA